jgi:hypothetical protein
MKKRIVGVLALMSILLGVVLSNTALALPSQQPLTGFSVLYILPAKP